MRVDEFQKKNDEQLRQMADECFSKIDTCSPPDRPALFLEAQFYVNEIGQRHDARIATRDLVLEIIVIVLILAEIVIGFVEGNSQAAILVQMNKSASATAATMQDLQKVQDGSLKALTMLTDEQTKSLASLDQMNTKLQSSVQKTSEMAIAAQKQLKIVQAAEASRQAELAKQPKLEIYIGTVSLTASLSSVTGVPVKETELTATKVTYDLALRNSGDASATKGILRIIVLAKDVTLESSAPFQRIHEDQPDSPQHVILVPFDYVRPNGNVLMSITGTYPAGQQPFDIFFNVDADEIPVATPLGNLIVRPPPKP